MRGPPARAILRSMAVAAPLNAEDLASLEAAGLGHIGQKVLAHLAKDRHEIEWRDAKIEKLTFEMAQLRRVKFGKKSEQLDTEQKALFDEAVDADLAALEAQLAELLAAKRKGAEAAPERPKRAALPPHLPRVDRHHEPDDTTCSCGCQLVRIGEDVSEKLDYTPGRFTVERHVRGKWTCAKCRILTQAPVPAEIIDKGLPTAGLLAHVLVAKHSDHLPLYRQEAIFERAGLAIPRSTLAAWVGVCGVRLQPLVDAMKAELLTLPVLHADETPVAMLAPGTGKTHRAYLWAYASGAFEAIRAVVYDFTESRSGQHPRAFLGHGTEQAWRGGLVCDDYSGYKALFVGGGVIEVGCMAHARRKFVELHLANKSTLAATAIEFIGQLYGIERDVKLLDPEDRLRERRTRAAPIAKALHDWLVEFRVKVPEGSATARAMDYSLNRWAALTRYLDNPALPIDNNFDEQQIRPWATGRKNWLFVGTLLAGQRAAAIMSLIQTAKLNGHDPYAYLQDVLTRLPTQKNSDLADLLPHRWRPAAATLAP
jgi:transposase